MELLEYKGYQGSIGLDDTGNFWRGKILFINDLVSYEAASSATLQVEFEVAVDDYLETCKNIGKSPHISSCPKV